MTFRSKPEIEATCRECGTEIAEGWVPHRSLDAFDDDPEPYCPNPDCQSGDLIFHKPKEDKANE